MAEGMSISALNMQTESNNLINSVKSSIIEDVVKNRMAEEEIITDIQKNKNGTIESAKDLANQYGIPLAKAESIMNKFEAREEKAQIVEEYLTEDALTHGAVLDNPPPENSTISYHV